MTKYWKIIFVSGFLLFGRIISVEGKAPVKKTDSMNTIELMKKRILLDSSKVLYDQLPNAEDFSKSWTIHHSKWTIQDGWLEGENPGNWPGIAILKQDFPGNVMVEFEDQIILPSKHDINVMWDGEWLPETDQIGTAYFAGLQGWWTGKVGIEKSRTGNKHEDQQMTVWEKYAPIENNG